MYYASGSGSSITTWVVGGWLSEVVAAIQGLSPFPRGLGQGGLWDLPCGLPRASWLLPGGLLPGETAGYR